MIKKLILCLCLCASSSFAQDILDVVDFQTVCLHDREECKLINRWFVEGTAAGNRGDYYDNRDRGHSALNLSLFPQMSSVDYSNYDRRGKQDWGGQTKIFKHVTLGNSSTSGNVKKTGSNVRGMYYSWDFGMKFLYLQYRGNNLYIYPEHQDYDAGHNGKNGYGDLFPTNSPYVVISNGSSGSDQPFLQAFAHTLAAFQPITKAKLITTGTLMPTMQMILRKTLKTLSSDEDYFTGKAHPTVFSGKDVDPVEMVKLAHAITPNAIPPLVQLRVLEEDRTPTDLEYFEIDKSETLADTPSVIARVWRSPAYTKRIVVSADKSLDANGRKLKFYWKVLRGSKENIVINVSENGRQAEIIVPYHTRSPIEKGSDICSNRIDIGVFASNGIHISAPAFVTFFTLDNEMRSYDDEGNLQEIYYSAYDLGYEVFDWKNLFKELNTGETWPALQLRRAFTQGELQGIHSIEQTYSQAYDKVIAAEETHRPKGPLARETKKALEEACKEAEEVMETKQSCLGNCSLKERLCRIFALIENNPKFYPDNLTLIDGIAASVSANERAKFLAQRNWLTTIGILLKTPDGFRLRSRVEDLTHYERQQLHKLNLMILTSVLYPNALKYWETANFVDSRLSSQKPWRDTFEYDDEGNVVAWTRYSGNTVTRNTLTKN